MKQFFEILLGIVCGLMLSVGIFIALNNYMISRWLAKKKWIKKLFGDKR